MLGFKGDTFTISITKHFSLGGGGLDFKGDTFTISITKQYSLQGGRV